MKRNTISIIFTSNGLLLLNKKVITNHSILSVNNYKVINSEEFINDISLIFKEQNINRHLLTDNINILIDSSYTKQDLLTLDSIFKELSFNKIEFINWLNNLKKEKYLLLNISNNVKIYYQNKTYVIKIIYNKYIEILETYIKILTNRYNIKSIRIFGDNKNIPSLRNEIEEKLNIKTYIYSNSLTYPLEQLQ